MSREISLFSDYHQKENSVTNYCGLILKLIYENSPKKFEEILTTLIQNDIDISVGPMFRQQTKRERSIPDLSITQNSFSIFFETKLGDWFYTDQIERHVEGFSTNSEIKILFLLSNFETNNFEVKFQDQISKAKQDNIILQPISFESFIGAIENVISTEYLENLVEEFKIYLDRNNLLPKWKYLLDVVNCGRTIHEIEDFSYMCPEKGGPYSHRRSKFFAPYANKKVNKIFEVDAVVVVDRDLGNGTIKWKNIKKKDAELIELAKSKIQKWEYRIQENKNIPLQVFLLKGGEETSFVKDSDGGLYSSKIYFWDIAKDVKTSGQLATKLCNKKWSEYK